MTVPNPIQSILVAVDLSERAKEVIGSAAELAIVSGAELHAIHVHGEPSLASGQRDLLTIQRQIHSKREALFAMIKRVAGRRVKVASARVQIGIAAEAILAEAKAVSADVIVIGAHRHRGVADRLFGSTAEHVVRRATVPCLILNGPLPLPVERILVPTDLSAPLRRITATALTWADLLSRNRQVEVTLAHVAEAGSHMDGPAPRLAQLREELATAASEAGRRADWKWPISVHLLRSNSPASALNEAASKMHAGLMVLGTHGDSILVRALLGSVSSAMVRTSAIPVLIVPRPASARATSNVRRPLPRSEAASIAV